jgi:hypothetical protein
MVLPFLQPSLQDKALIRSSALMFERNFDLMIGNPLSRGAIW